MFKFILLLVCAISVQSVHLPSNFEKCNRHQPNFKQCVLHAAQSGVYQLTKPFKEVNLPNLNPLEIPEFSITKGGNGKVAVNQHFTDCKFYGFHQIHFDQFEFDFEHKVVHVKGYFPQITQKCHYQMDGKVLLLPIQGEGPSTVTFKNLATTAHVYYKEYEKHGKTYLNFFKSELDINPEHITYNFENLFNGDHTLGDNVNKVLNDNWKDVFDDLKPAHVEIVNKILLGLVNSFFAKVSTEEAFD